MALLEGSPAIDHALSAYSSATDQRGIARPFGNGSDIGAFESASPYSVRGHIFGSAAVGSIVISNGTTSIAIPEPGFYSLFGMQPGAYTITASATNGVLIPNSRSVTVGPDVIDFDFRVFLLNALTVETYTNQVLHLIFAGKTGETNQVQSSVDLTNWTTVATNTVAAEGIYDFFYTNKWDENARFFRTIGN
jgi:hypothetical protein